VLLSFETHNPEGKTMKNVLLATSALALTAGVAHAEITFSGKAEAGIYRTAPTAAVAAVAGRDARFNDNAAAAQDVSSADATDLSATTAPTAIASGADQVQYVNGVLTVVAATANTATAAAPVTADELQAHLAEIGDIEAQLVTARGNLAVDTTKANADAEKDAIALLEAKLAAAKKVYDLAKGSAAAAKGATPKLKAYSGYDFNVALSGASDNGMTFAMGFDMGAGHIADQDDDRAMDAQGGSIATDELTITYAGYTVGIGNDNIDDLYDDTQNGDISLSGSLGDLTFSLVTDMDEDVKAVAASQVYTNSATAGADTFVDTAAVAAVYNPTSYAIGYKMGNIAFSMAGTEHDDRGHAAAKMSLNYTVSDALSVKLESDNVGTYKDIAKVSVTSKISDALSITASVKDDKDHALNTNTGGKQSQDVSISYSAGALSSTLATDEGSNWWVNAKYDLGGGAQAFTTFDHTEFLVAGVNFAF